MKKTILLFVLVSSLVLGLMALVANAAPTSTNVQNLVITALPSAPCLKTTATGLVATTTCGGAASGSSTILIAGGGQTSNVNVTLATTTTSNTWNVVCSASSCTLTMPSNVGFFVNDSGYVTSTITISTSTAAGVFNVTSSANKAFTITFPPAKDQYFAPSTTIATNNNQLTNGAGFITTSTWVINASGTNITVNNNGGSSTVAIIMNPTFSSLTATNVSTTNLTASGTIQFLLAPVDASGNKFVTSTSGGSSAVTFLANGFNFVTTSTINFSAGSNITITTSTNGTYTITASGGSGGLASTTPFTVGNLAIVSSSGAIATYPGSTCAGGQAVNGLSASGTATGCFTPSGGGSSTTMWGINGVSTTALSGGNQTSSLDQTFSATWTGLERFNGGITINSTATFNSSTIFNIAPTDAGGNKFVTSTSAGTGGLASTTPFTVGNLTVVSSSGALATFGGSTCTGGQFAQSVSASGTVLCGTAAGSGNGNVTVTAANVATSSFPYWLKGASSTLSVSSTLFIIPSTGDISVGTSTDGGRPFYVYGTTANGVMVVERNTQDNVAAQWDTYRIQADASGSAQNGFGPALEFDMKDSSGTNNVATIVAQRANNRSDTADLQFFGFSAGSQTNALDLHYTGHLSVNGTTDCGVGCILGIPTESASSSFLTLGNNLISGGNASGTFLGANPSSPFNGDFINFQIASTSKFKVDGSGNVSSAGGLTAGGNITATGTLSTTGAATIGGNVTVTGGTVFANTLDTTNSQTLTLKAGPGASMMTLGQGTGIVNVTAGNQLQENGTRVVVQTRNVNTTSPLTGGGALSGDLTLACATCNVSTSTATFGLTMATSTGGTIATQTTSITPFRMPFAGTLLGWTATANASCTGSVDIWKLANAVPTKTNTITGGSFVALSSSNFATGTISGWTTSFSQGDLFMMNTTSTNSGCQAITVELDYKKS